MTESKPFPYALVTIIWLGWIFINQSIFILNPILPAIEDHFQILHVQAGVLIGSYNVGYALMQLFAGASSDKFGEKRFLVVGILGTSLSTILTWRLTDYFQMIIIRFITGLFAGMYYAPSNSLITKAASGKDRGKAIGLVFSSAGASTMLIYVLTGILIMQNVFWQDLFLFFGLPGIIFSPLMFFLLKKQEVKKPTHSERVKVKEPNRTVYQTLKQRTVLKILTFNLLMAFAMWSINTFLPLFFVTERGLTIPEASFLINAASASGIFCMPIGGYLTDKVGFKIPSYLSMMVLSLMSLFIPAFPVGMHTIIAFILWGLFGCMANTAVMVFLTDVVPHTVRGTFFGILNFVGWIGGTLGPILLGNIIDLFGFTSFFYSVLLIYIVATIIILTTKKY